ncbi:hypothetical protein FD754_013282 [Muntiacus muntjak]|uniref:RNA helicase n=1 Tax=Muntiacus muntjak TaxID=9888 RepID=A0A5N3VJB9_MUNMU|nr:hypothetical protein FD754_013282 [Muntiacus muntjak]
MRVATAAGTDGLAVFPGAQSSALEGGVGRGEGKLLLAPRAFGAPFPCLQSRRPARRLTSPVCALPAPLPRQRGQGGAAGGCGLSRPLFPLFLLFLYDQWVYIYSNACHFMQHSFILDFLSHIVSIPFPPAVSSAQVLSLPSVSPSGGRLVGLCPFPSALGLHCLLHASSVLEVCGLSYPVACGTDQRSNLCPLHWQMDSYPPRRQGSPSFISDRSNWTLFLCFSSKEQVSFVHLTRLIYAPVGLLPGLFLLLLAGSLRLPWMWQNHVQTLYISMSISEPNEKDVAYLRDQYFLNTSFCLRECVPTSQVYDFTLPLFCKSLIAPNDLSVGPWGTPLCEEATAEGAVGELQFQRGVWRSRLTGSCLLRAGPGAWGERLGPVPVVRSVFVDDVRFVCRAGRVSKGYCYRLVHKDFWDSSIPSHVIPEMLRCPLGSTILKVKLLDMGEPRALLATALSPPSLSDIERTILLLKEVGALAVSGRSEDENPHDGELTFLGRVLAQLPVNQQLGKLIVLGHVFGCLDECLIIAARAPSLSLITVWTGSAWPERSGQLLEAAGPANQRSNCQFRLCFPLVCTPAGEMRVVQVFWGRGKVAELYEELKTRISQFNMYVDSRRPVMDQEYPHKQRFILQVVLAGAFYPNYFTFGQPDEEIAVRELAGKDPKTTVVLKHIPPYGFLYHQQLQSLFRQCGQVKSIVFDGANRAFVEFSRNPTERFKTLPAVYMAIKMSQLKAPLDLSVHSAEEIEAKVQGGAVSKLRNTRVNVDFQKQTVDPMQVSFNTPDKSRTITDLLLTIEVTEVVEVGHFWGYRTDEKNWEFLKRLTAAINRLTLVPLPVHPHPDLVCLAPFADNDKESYFRAQILYVSGNSAEVFFVDYGNRARVALGVLMEIPCQFLELPFQALEFKICKMRPSAQCLVCGERWSGAAGRRFSSLVSGRTLLVKVFSVMHSVLHVDAYLPSGLQDTVSIRGILIGQGYAEPAEEPYESKQSHEVLKGLFSKSVENLTDMSMVSPGKEDEKYLIRILLESFSSNKLGNPNCKAVLHGPFNPYELKCHSLTRTSKFRCVWIEKESINSVIISDSPEDVHQRLLVAASLSVNTTGSTMLLRETSLMPHIPGLPALLSMLFAPVMELRVGQDGKCYTGVLCGLGCNLTTGAPVLPEHDMELAFDVQFSVEDVMEINILRAAVNKLVCDGPNGSKCLGPERIAQLQDSSRQKLLGLFCQLKPREKVVPKWHEKPYEWNQVDPKLVMEQADRESSRGKNTFLYQLHKLIVLSS